MIPRLAVPVIRFLAAILGAPAALVMRYPWRDPMGARASWAVVGAYLLMLAVVVAAVFFGD